MADQGGAVGVRPLVGVQLVWSEDSAWSVFIVASARGLNDKHPLATPFFLFITIISSTGAPRQTREKKKSVAGNEKIKLLALKCILRSVSIYMDKHFRESFSNLSTIKNGKPKGGSPWTPKALSIGALFPCNLTNPTETQ